MNDESASTGSRADAAPEGVDATRVEAWMAEHAPSARPPLAIDLIAGGHSNLTMSLTDTTGRRWVLRRPPLGQVLDTAHDMGREHRIISALGPTDVPVPRTVGLCEDADVIGAPFYVMEFVDGTVVRTADDAARLSETARATAGESLVRTLAGIHAVDVDAVGLGDLGPREAYLERQLRRWHRQFEHSQSQVDDPLPDLASIHLELAASVPPQERFGIVHGDYRLDNCMLGDDGEVVAVLDWEICTLGDTLADVGLLCCYWPDPGDRAALPQVASVSLAGFPRRADLLRSYERHTGADLSGIDYYMAFGYWKLACIIAGVYARYAGGAMGEDARSAAEGFRHLLDGIRTLAVDALERSR